MNFYQLLLYDEFLIVRSTGKAGRRAGKRSGSEKDSKHQVFSGSYPDRLPEISVKWQNMGGRHEIT